MNDIIWLLYLADVVNNLAFILTFLSVMGGLGLVFVLWCVFEDDAKWGVVKQGGGILAGMIVTAILLPGKNVFYAMAAAKVAEQPRVQATATKALDALDAWLDKQIKEKDND
jgi:hypothetical protein